MPAFLKQPLVIATLVACLCGLLALGDPIDQMYWNTRFRYANNAAPQSIVLVEVGSQGSDARDTWSGTQDAELLKKIAAYKPHAIFFDRQVDENSPQTLRDEIAALGNTLTFVARDVRTDALGQPALVLPPRSVVGNARIVASSWWMNFIRYGLYSNTAIQYNGHAYQTFSAALADMDTVFSGKIIPDFTINPDSIKRFPALDIINNKKNLAALSGKNVIISDLKSSSSLTIGYFGRDRIGPVNLDIAGASALKSGLSVNIGWIFFVILFTLLAFVFREIKNRNLRWTSYAIIFSFLIIIPSILQRYGIYSNPSASFIAATFYSGWQIWSKWRLKVLQTSQSGLPNFVGLTEVDIPQGTDLIVAVIARYEEFLATLPRELHGECARQIARRISVGGGAQEIFHGEGGHFAWFAPSLTPERQVEHLEGMRALFSAPLLIGGHMFDTNIHFGLDRNGDLDTLTRLNTALASATEALKHGRTIEQYEPNRLANAPWELSLLARIDEGLRNGDIWVAFQPQWDYHALRISGAEALIRWNDPVRGPIRPDEFILQAERAGRIDALTYWVLDQAITAAQAFNGLGADFQMSINLSAQLVDKPSLVPAITEVVRRRGMDARLLTIEVTETASLYNRSAAIQNLQQLRTLGFRLSIDDFGTGEASLCYLAELPSDELKLDRRFVSRIVHHERERQIVSSTINLAHALNQTVVAEGIEDLTTFDVLRQMGCDAGQGYYIGRPETLEQLLSRYTAVGGERGALFRTC